jgi:hypothetical protein
MQCTILGVSVGFLPGSKPTLIYVYEYNGMPKCLYLSEEEEKNIRLIDEGPSFIIFGKQKQSWHNSSAGIIDVQLNRELFKSLK